MNRFQAPNQLGNSFVFEGGEKGYPWLFFYLRRSWVLSLFATLLVVVPTWVFYNWYVKNGQDPSPDSVLGYTFAIVGTILMMMALVGFSLRRRSRKRKIGQLNRSLNWHMFFGMTGLALFFMHSFGNFNPRTGTYALYGMIAMAVSGLIGRFLDQIIPRMITSQIDEVLTGQGDDQVERISQQVRALMEHNAEGNSGFVPVVSGAPVKSRFIEEPGGASWDLAYITLDATPQELNREASYRLVPDRKSRLTRPGAMVPGADEQMRSLQRVQVAMRKEHTYRYILRYWRAFHIFLAFTTIGLTLWHLEYAATLLIPTFMH
jgi:hypothetical protein